MFQFRYFILFSVLAPQYHYGQEACNTTQNEFGPNCTSICHCLKGSCDNETGICDDPGCEAGWKGDNCTIPCNTTQNEFGPNCTSICHCLKESCDNETGICDDPGCKAGWKGDNCTIPCNTTQNEFGPNCTSICHCLKGSCDNETGICDDPGCEAGWKGNNCTIPCNTTQNEFGPNCTSICHCLKGSCDNETGICDDPGCEAGWKGDNCTITCDSDTFGLGCSTTCHCLTGSCNPITGVCDTPGCKTKYKGESCSIGCEANSFGQDCKSTCHCLTGSCPTDTGICYTPDCKPGWRNKTCSEPCMEKTFGQGCKEACYCLNGTCDPINGKCAIPSCAIGYEGETCSKEINNTPSFDSLTTTIPGISAGALGFLLVVIITIICIFRRRRNPNPKPNPDVKVKKHVDKTKTNFGGDPEHVYLKLYSPVTEVLKEDNYVDVEATFEKKVSPSTAISRDKIRDDVVEKIKDGTLQMQHKNFPSGPFFTQFNGNLPKNKKKNRNHNLLPYDHSRVELKTSDESEDALYINASYISGLAKDSKYIATQGPMKNTIEDFWRMVWQNNSSVIVMLTNIIEDKQETCSQYWPEYIGALAILEYEIVLLEETTKVEFITRKFKVKNTKTGEIRRVWHLQFTSWPLQGVPNPYQLLLLHRKYIEVSVSTSGPAIIHCSDGCDRSGVFIAFDSLSKHFNKHETVDICALVAKMRDGRMNMVTTKESYVLVHELLLEHLQFQDTCVTTNDFHKVMEEGNNREDSEYEMLANNLPEYDDHLFKVAMLKKNRGKHRNQSILPVETYRVIVNRDGKAHYINALAIPSCRMSKHFLVTQIPFSNTVMDLWNMIYEYNSSTVVSLEDTPSFEKGLIWYPTDENKLVLGNLFLTKTSDSMTRGSREISLKVSDKEHSDEKLVKLFQYLNWRPGSVTPSPQSSFLAFIHLVLSWNKSTNNGPITVICSDGAKCCGLFCLVYSVIENLGYSEEIDIYQIARLQQIRRPQFFSVEQYHFCYSIVKEYLEKGELYNEIE